MSIGNEKTQQIIILIKKKQCTCQMKALLWTRKVATHAKATHAVYAAHISPYMPQTCMKLNKLIWQTQVMNISLSKKLINLKMVINCAGFYYVGGFQETQI